MWSADCHCLSAAKTMRPIFRFSFATGNPTIIVYYNCCEVIIIITSKCRDVVLLDKLKEIISFLFFKKQRLVKNKTLYLDMASVNTHCL